MIKILIIIFFVVSHIISNKKELTLIMLELKLKKYLLLFGKDLLSFIEFFSFVYSHPELVFIKSIHSLQYFRLPIHFGLNFNLCLKV